MVTDRPVESLTGQDGWDWNEWQAERSGSASTESSGEHPDKDREPTRDDRSRPRQREVRDLEAKVERTERRLQRVVDRYERLLAEKNRKLAREQSPAEDDRRSAVVSRIVRCLIGR